LRGIGTRKAGRGFEAAELVFVIGAFVDCVVLVCMCDVGVDA
jgi:hypothetical protein